jgi:hypothetical protein
MTLYRILAQALAPTNMKLIITPCSVVSTLDSLPTSSITSSINSCFPKEDENMYDENNIAELYEVLG